jgi:hypothetical protein
MAGSIQGIYVGRSEEWLLQRRDWIQGEIDKALQGKRFQSVASGGNSAARQHLSMSELKTEMLEIQYALRGINPTLYGGKKVRRFYTDFSAVSNA